MDSTNVCAINGCDLLEGHDGDHHEVGDVHEIQVIAARPETAPMRFGDDWTGIYLRGDQAFMFAVHLRELLDLRKATDSAHEKIHLFVVEGLISTLESCRHNGPIAPAAQVMKPFVECLVEDQSIIVAEELALSAEGE